MRPEQLALRAINQYRSRDMIAYLGLRYYFSNTCALRDHWAHDVAGHLLMTRSQPSYFKTLHFKDIYHSGKIDHREIFLPGPNEAFAETALLAECAKHQAFHALPCVFSYRLITGRNNSGVFLPYFSGIQKRHLEIAKACKDQNEVVFYTDIKRFYPSITSATASNAWAQACAQAEIDPYYRNLGERLLENYSNVSKSTKLCNGVLTGPMFSHLIANLVLRDIDEKMVELFPNRYFRYVDDIVLIGNKQQVAKGRKQLITFLEKLELTLHDQGQGKDFEIDTNEWLKGANDFDGSISSGWRIFTRDLKQFLVSQPLERDALASMFLTEGFRIPLPDYRVATEEASYLERIQDLAFIYPWFRRHLKRNTPARLLLFAKILREHYLDSLRRLLDLSNDISGYGRKRIIPKIRYFSGRLLFLADTETLSKLAASLRTYPELYTLAEVMQAIASQDVSKLLPLGTNAVQSAAQALRQDLGQIKCTIDSWDPASRQGLAILIANGIRLNIALDDDLNHFAVWEGHGRALMESHDPFMQEIACLHGPSTIPRHNAILKTAFDRNEELAFDVINQLQDSDYV